MDGARTEGRLFHKTVLRKGGPAGGSLAGYLSKFALLGEYFRLESGAAAKALEVGWLWPNESLQFSVAEEKFNTFPVMLSSEGAGIEFETVFPAEPTMNTD